MCKTQNTLSVKKNFRGTGVAISSNILFKNMGIPYSQFSTL